MTFGAKLLTIIHAISYAWEREWTRLWLESDSSYMVHLISTRNPDVPWHWLAAWTNCFHNISSVCFQVSHIFREGKSFADALSSHTVHLLGVVVSCWFCRAHSDMSSNPSYQFLFFWLGRTFLVVGCC